MTIPRHKALEPLVKMSQVAVNSFTSLHLPFLLEASRLCVRSWDAEHCQGADKDCGSVSLQTLKILTLCIYVPSQFCPPEFKPFTILNHVVWSLSVLKARIPTILVP